MAEYGPPSNTSNNGARSNQRKRKNLQSSYHQKNNNNNHRNQYKRRRYQSPKPKKKRIIKCGICNVNEFKYRCPNCRVLRYCSVACYQKHKEDTGKCIKPKKKLKFDQNDPISVSGYTVTQQQFKLLGM